MAILQSQSVTPTFKPTNQETEWRGINKSSYNMIQCSSYLSIVLEYYLLFFDTMVLPAFTAMLQNSLMQENIFIGNNIQ